MSGGESGAEPAPYLDVALSFDLADVDSLPVADHAAVYDGLHRRLQQALASLDEL